MALTARNQLEGTVKGMVLGDVMAEVVVDVGGQEMVAAVTRHAVESLGIKAGDRVRAVFQATDVMLEV